MTNTLNNLISKGFTKGFTMVELIIIMTIISILAAIVVPRFIDLKTTAQENTVKSIAEGLNAFSASNYQLGRTGSPKAISISNCQNFENALPQSQPLPNNCSITPLPITSHHSECEVRCSYDNGSVIITETFIGYKVP